MTRASAGRRTASTFRCAECGAGTPRWVGRCPECQAWGTVAETGAVARPVSIERAAIQQPARPIGEIDAAVARHRPTGVDELDRVCGGGLVAGAVVLLAGEPGVGKSTLLLEVGHRFARDSDRPTLIVTGEESAAQVRLRAERTGASHPKLYVAAESDVGAVLSHVDQVQPGLLVVDSIQTISTSAVDSAAGSVAQIRAVAAALIAVAKERAIATVIVGHVTKDGGIAGPRLLEHLVDVVLHFEGERHSALRLIRATKNRFGAADEIGCFEMRDDGIVGLADPSGLFLSERTTSVAGTCATVTVEGRRPLVTEVQALVVPAAHGGTPRRAVTDLDSGRVAMLLAVLTRHARIRLPEREVYAATVGGLPAAEPAADLAIALAVASAAHDTPIPSTVVAIGEVSLSGDIRRVAALERRLAEAARLGFTVALVPAGHAGETIRPAAAGIATVPVATLDAALTAVASVPDRPQTRRRAKLRPLPDGPSDGAA